MEKFLTAKATPSKLLVMAEVAAAVASGVALLIWLMISVYGLIVDGFHLVHVLLLLCALPWMLLLGFLIRRWRDRSRAKRIISLLCTSARGVMSSDDLYRAGISSPEELIAKLTARKYIRSVIAVQGEVRLNTGELHQAVCAYCGASMLFRKEGVDKCPSCGSAAIKYL